VVPGDRQFAISVFEKAATQHTRASTRKSGRRSMLFIATSHRLAELNMSSLWTFSIAPRASTERRSGWPAAGFVKQQFHALPENICSICERHISSKS
jgi:hypothetical protein